MPYGGMLDGEGFGVKIFWILLNRISYRHICPFCIIRVHTLESSKHASSSNFSPLVT